MKVPRAHGCLATGLLIVLSALAHPRARAGGPLTAEMPSRPPAACLFFQRLAAPISGFGKSLVFPGYGTLKLGKIAIETFRDGSEHKFYRIGMRFTRENGIYALGYLTLYLVGKHTMMSTFDFDDATDHSFTPDPHRGVYVFVDGFTDADKLKIDAAAQYASRKEKFPNVIRIYAQNSDELYKKLSEIARDSGPITHMEMLSHSTPGEIGIGQTILLDPPDTFNAAAVFAPGAQIKFRGCFSGAKHHEVINRMEMLGDYWLVHGGRTIGSRVSLSGSPYQLLTGKRATPIIKQIESLLVYPMGGVIGPFENLLASEEGMFFDPDDKTRVYEVQPQDKRPNEH